MHEIFCHKKEWITGTYHNMDETQKHYAIWKNLDTNEHTFYDLTYINYPE